MVLLKENRECGKAIHCFTKAKNYITKRAAENTLVSLCSSFKSETVFIPFLMLGVEYNGARKTRNDSCRPAYSVLKVR